MSGVTNAVPRLYPHSYAVCKVGSTEPRLCNSCRSGQTWRVFHVLAPARALASSRKAAQPEGLSQAVALSPLVIRLF